MGNENVSQGFETEWNNGLLSCCSPFDLCLKATCCPCFVFGKTQARLRDPSLQTYSSVNSDCLIWFGLGYCSLAWIYQFMEREKMRRQFHLKGSGLGDCCVTFWCPCCSLIQSEKEVLQRLENGADNAKGYVSPSAGMVAAPQT